MNGIDAAAS
jgi:hypothetical protein